MGIERVSMLDRYHDLFHKVSAAFGYHHHEATPDWVHPFLHLILVLAPLVLIAITGLLLVRFVLIQWRRPRVSKLQKEWIRGLDQSPYAFILGV